MVEGKPGQLNFMLEQNGKNLSGGQKQRLTIARALVKKPEILILDDSASALDFATDAALRKSLNRLDWKVTTFLVSQRSSSIQQADLILSLIHISMESPAPTPFTSLPFGAGSSNTFPSSATRTAPSPAMEISTFLAPFS